MRERSEQIKFLERKYEKKSAYGENVKNDGKIKTMKAWRTQSKGKNKKKNIK